MYISIIQPMLKFIPWFFLWKTSIICIYLSSNLLKICICISFLLVMSHCYSLQLFSINILIKMTFILLINFTSLVTFSADSYVLLSYIFKNILYIYRELFCAVIYLLHYNNLLELEQLDAAVKSSQYSFYPTFH